MKRSRGKVTGAAVAAFLILEPKFPRSVQYCATSARERLASICDRDDRSSGRAPRHARSRGARELKLDGRLAGSRCTGRACTRC